LSGSLFFLALLLNTYAVLEDASILKIQRRDAEQQLADLDWQVHILHLERRF
jgi:hypothetical protein